MPRVKRHGRWVVVVSDKQTQEHITTRIVFARTAEDAAAEVGVWLDLEGFEVEVRIEVGPQAESHY